MKVTAFNNTYILRIDKGEEVVASLKSFCTEQGITLGYFQGLGATDNAVLGLFMTSTKEYVTTEVTGDHEITSLTGNISQMNGDVYLHTHATLAGEGLQMVGGHLTSAVISGTCEITLVAIEGEVGRIFDDTVGLNIYAF